MGGWGVRLNIEINMKIMQPGDANVKIYRVHTGRFIRNLILIWGEVISVL